MKYYCPIIDCFSKNEMLNIKNVLSINTDHSFIESLLYYNINNNIKFNITHYNLNYNELIHDTKLFLEKLYKNQSFEFINNENNENNENINNPIHFNKLITTLNKYDIINICTQTDPVIINKNVIKNELIQTTYSSIILSLKQLNENGSLMILYKYDDNFKQISFLLTTSFEEIEYFYNDIIEDNIYIICKGFKGVSNADHKILYSVLEDLYKKNPNTETVDKLVEDNKKYRIISLFDFKYTDKFNEQFDKVVKRKAYLIEKANTSIKKSKLHKLDWNNEQINKYIDVYTKNDIKANIEMAHKYGLSVKPKYLDYNGKYEQQVLEHMYTLEDTIIKPFSKYNFECDYENGFIKKNYKFDRFDKYRDSINIMKFTMETRNWKKFNVLIKEISIGYTIREYTKKLLNVHGSRAFFKLYEVLVKFPNLIPNSNAISTLHICEAPGKFIAATNHYIKTKTNIQEFKWNANSLNPNVRKDGFKDMYGYMKKYPDNWLWGKDKTGDITKVENIKHIVKHAKENLGEISFMTSDCGMDVSDDYNSQELLNTKLSLAHVIIALMALKEGGSAFFKVYLPLTETINISLVYLLYCAFEKISFIKQLSASPYNSEIYIVCENYTKVSDDLINKLLDFLDNFTFKNGETFIKKEDIPNEFLYQYEKFIKELIKNQRKALLRLFYYYDYPEMYEKHHKDIIKYRNKKTEHWIKIMNLKQLDKNKSL
jgi:hypothetical protein